MMSTDLKTEQCAVLMNFLELTLFSNDWWEYEGTEFGNLINLGTEGSAGTSVWVCKFAGMMDMEKQNVSQILLSVTWVEMKSRC